MQECIILERGHTIPFSDVRDAIERMEYASPLRCYFLMCVFTGCRLSEPERMQRANLYGDLITWRPGKKCKRDRFVRLPHWYIVELGEYWANHPVPGSRIFHWGCLTFRRMFDAFRPQLGEKWLSRRMFCKQSTNKDEYYYQLKGLRKNYQTLEFARQLNKWKDAGVALEFTSKEMAHSSARITAYHYIENFDSLAINLQRIPDLQDILKGEQQKRLVEF